MLCPYQDTGLCPLGWPVISPAEPCVPSTGPNTEGSLSLQLSAEAKHSSDTSQLSSGDKASVRSVGIRRRASTTAGKKSTDGHTFQSQKQHLMDSTSSQVRCDLHWLMPGTFLLPLRSEGAAYSVDSMSPESGVGDIQNHRIIYIGEDL